MGGTLSKKGSGRTCSRTRKEAEMRLTWRDAMVTVFVAAAAVVYGLWQSGTAMTGTTTRAMAAIVFALGFLGCMGNRDRIGEVYSPDADRRPPMTYVVLASLIGLVALISGVWAIVGASETMLAVLIGSMGVLWLITTGRHVMVVAPEHHDREVTGAHAHVA
jgi:hypothetical protein